MRPATSADIPEAARVLAEAFYDDPIQTWLLPDPGRRLRRLERLFTAELGHFLQQGRALVTTAPNDVDLASVALWATADRWRPPALVVLRLSRAYLAAIGPRAVAGVRLLRELDRTHPTEPHWYLGVLGTTPAHQGRGFASAVLGPVLDECDREAVPAYLESSKEANLAFYARHGFEVVEAVELSGAPPVWRMWRAPRER